MTHATLGLLLLLPLASAADERSIAAVPKSVESLKEFLLRHGLAEYEAKIKAKGVDSLADLEWLEDGDIDSIWGFPAAKRNILKEMASVARSRRRHERNIEWNHRRWSVKIWTWAWHTGETLLRGFFLGFGLST